MVRFIVRIFLTAILFCFICPKIASGVQFHGQFWPDGVLYAAVFAVVAYLVTLGIKLAETVFSLATLGLGLLIVIPLNLLGWWLVPAIQLQVFSSYYPEQFSVAGWGSAIWVGLLLMVVNGMTAAITTEKKASE